jgi:gluconolactonase
MKTLTPRIFDDRTCQLGEGPNVSGANNQLLHWVDILGKRVLWRDSASGEFGEWSTDSHVGFVIPTTDNAFVLGTADGPVLKQEDGSIRALPARTKISESPLRWNDGKRGPAGEYWLGTSAYGAEGVATSLYRLSADLSEISLQLDGLGLANGMDWSPDHKYFYFIDTVGSVLKRFKYADGEISDSEDVIAFDSDTQEFPDGMTVDSEGCIWIAFWNGSCVRRYSPDFQEIFRIDLPTRFVTSCVFGGEKLNQLFITTAVGDGPWRDDSPEAGMTFVVDTEFKGKASY